MEPSSAMNKNLKSMAASNPMPKSDIVLSVLHFLNDEFNDVQTSSDRKESLEVAIQCIETAFDLGSDWRQKPRKLDLMDFVRAYGGPRLSGNPVNEAAMNSEVDLGEPYQLPAEASAEDKAKAEEFKNKGNECMRDSKYEEALELYTKAIRLDGRNAAYFSNRAAAYIKLDKVSDSLRDCQIAIQLQPNYARAYGRMGVTYTNEGKHLEAIVCFKKAMGLDPECDIYKKNLQYSQSCLSQQAQESFNRSSFNEFFNNPTLINLATNMLQQPSMQNMLSQIIGNSFPGAPPDASASAPPQGGLDGLMQIGNAIASSLRNSNPDLAESILAGAQNMQNFQQQGGNDGSNNDSQRQNPSGGSDGGNPLE